MLGLLKGSRSESALSLPSGPGDVVQLFSGAIGKSDARTDHTTAAGYNLSPGTIGAGIKADLNLQPKQAIRELSGYFPTGGLEPEQRAQLNLTAKLSAKAADDARAYTKAAKEIMGNLSEIYESQVEHKSNAMQADLKVKRADVEYMGSVDSWQQETRSLVDKARERHAGIQLAASCL